MKQNSTSKVCNCVSESSVSVTHPFSGILTGGAEDFESGDDLYEAIGAILHEIAAEKAEDDIR